MARAIAAIRFLSGFLPVRYVLAGACATAANFLVRFPLSEMFRFEFAVATAQAIGLVIGFLLYRTFVFRGAATTLPQQVIAFGSVNLAATVVVITAAIGLRSFLLGAGLEVGYAEPLAHAAALALGAPVNFCGHLLVTFSRRGWRLLQRLDPA